MAGRFIRNVRKPEGILGGLMLKRMNKRHVPLADWGFGYLDLREDARVLEAGCGGGANIARILSEYPKSRVTGLDYSEKSVAVSRKKNRTAIKQGRCEVISGDVSHLPFHDDSFDAVTACETVYFWPDIRKAFSEVYRVLRCGGTFLIICELSDDAETNWEEKVGPMTVYDGGELEELLRDAGFDEIRLFREGPQWITVRAEKPSSQK